MNMRAVANPTASDPLPDATPRRLRVLVIDEEFPYPPNAGKRIRSWNLLSRLAKTHDVTWLSYGPIGEDSRQAAQAAGIKLHVCGKNITKQGIALYFDLLLNLFSRYPYSVAKHYSAEFQQQLSRLTAMGDFDLMHCEWGPYARYLEAARLPTVVSAHNIETQIWERRAENSSGLASRLFFRLQARKMGRFEARVLPKAQVVTAVSAPDQKILTDWGCKHAAVVDNGVDIQQFVPTAPELENPDQLLFLASLDWFPNQDALWYFIREILPALRQKSPAIKVHVVGRRLPEDQARELQQTPGVVFVGEVADVRDSYRTASIVVVPLRIGGGSRLKILEAMAAGKAIVSTSIGAEGLHVTKDEHLLIADTVPEFSDSIERLRHDVELRRTLGAAGRRLVETRYSWDRLAKDMEAAWFRAVEVRA